MSGVKFNICDLRTSYIPDYEVDGLEGKITRFISPELQYSCTYWVHHGMKAAFRGTEGSDFSRMIDGFLLSTRALFWLEVMCLVGRLPAARIALLGVRDLEVR